MSTPIVRGATSPAQSEVSLHVIDIEATESDLRLNKTLPARWYWDPAVLDVELSEVFARGWHVVGPAEQLSKPGDFVTCDAGRVPIVVTHTVDGEIRGFVNVCRHRGYLVASGSGNRKTLQCPYHGWTYNLDGRLRGAPFCEKTDFDFSEIALLPTSVETWNGIVFVNPDAAAGSLSDSFPELEGIATDWELDFGGYRYDGAYTYDIDANWKAWCENGNECYHCPTIHRGTFDSTFRSLDERTVLTTDNLIGAINGYRDSSELLSRHGEKPTFGERYVFLYPGTFISKDDYVAFAGSTIPLGPEKTRFVSHMWVREGIDQALLDDWLVMWDETFKEDVEAVERQQSGLRSRTIDSGQLSATADTMILNFHRLVVRSLKAFSAVGR